MTQINVMAQEDNTNILLQPKGQNNRMLGTRFDTFRENLVSQIVYATSPLQHNQKDLDVAVDAALDVMEAFNPQDEIEAMLLTQLIAAHNTSMYCLANTASLSLEQQKDYFNYANKFMRTYATLVEGLHKHRNQGQSEQKITVQHVQVNDGGQAIVGNITQPSS
ncbi:hypothetical protein [Candidatus Odyssella thessalonicensis]|uniref:hypothetical protein n=1 Tax=Candidatus Odyssella thessalonicensis TaxID=84647 RepID=UPI000225ACA9|nr:hypothetical protein [Candidatus Odyssella thessalonicensis]